jgi:hypothetical protein
MATTPNSAQSHFRCHPRRVVAVLASGGAPEGAAARLPGTAFRLGFSQGFVNSFDKSQ